MAEVKWIKLSTDLFQNRKIKQIRKLPDGSDICLMWLQLLCLAGQINDHGQVYITEDIPYTEDTLATEFDLPIQTVRLGLKVFEQFGMIEVVDNFLHLASWERYQSVEKLDKYREYQREYHREYRAKQKALTMAKGEEINGNKCLRKIDVNAIDIDKDKEIDIDTEKDNKVKEIRHKYGSYKNVLLTETELEKLKAEYPADWQERIERLSEYMASTGKPYKSHLATIRAWARKEGGGQKQAPAFESRKGSYFQPQAKSISYAEYQAAAVAVDEEDEELPFGKGNH